MTALPDLHVFVEPMLLGIKWLDPDWLLSEFGGAFLWVSLAMVFVECGLFFPFLPGDTLLFALGLFIAGGKYDVLGIDNKAAGLAVAMSMLTVAAFLGNVAGYEIGRRIGPPLYQRDGRIIKRAHLDKTSAFFEKHGNKALVIGRFVPFVRTYITVVAGVTLMERRRFFTWSAVGAVLWVVSITLLGYFLGETLPGARGEHRLRRPRHPRVLGDPVHLRVHQAPPPPRRERRGRGRRSESRASGEPAVEAGPGRRRGRT